MCPYPHLVAIVHVRIKHLLNLWIVRLDRATYPFSLPVLLS